MFAGFFGESEPEWKKAERLPPTDAANRVATVRSLFDRVHRAVVKIHQLVFLLANHNLDCDAVKMKTILGVEEEAEDLHRDAVKRMTDMQKFNKSTGARAFDIIEIDMEEFLKAAESLRDRAIAIDKSVRAVGCGHHKRRTGTGVKVM